MSNCIQYALQDLYRDQPRDYVIDAIPSLLAWITRQSASVQPAGACDFAVDWRGETAGVALHLNLKIIWDIDRLVSEDQCLLDRVRRLKTGKTVDREHVTENAAYGLAFVAISTFLPGQKVMSMRLGLPPDILFDVTPNALRGVEVAGRTSGGRYALNRVQSGDGSKENPGKESQLRLRVDIAEAYLSLWCNTPSIGSLQKVKP
ncbi:hypothetical protein F0U61_18080 [Archangium violaceum]|uniref:hypothetical protein n=1 Tax=Archangium violaceum TaxID=83451 RepID=UPI002B294A5F|nr:hypothetical protein F0U61_18080 [Archangium violaceum]